MFDVCMVWHVNFVQRILSSYGCCFIFRFLNLLYVFFWGEEHKGEGF